MEEIVAQLSNDLANKPVIPADDDQPQHPRFGDFKNEGKVAESQRRRRQEHLERQACARDERVNRYRELHDADKDAGYGNNAFRRKKPADTKSPYANQLMLSDWLVDIPCSLSTEWTMLPSPVGQRCLVVAQKEITTVYNKRGRELVKFYSRLPGGGYQSSSTTMLDCIFVKQKKEFFILDVLYWKDEFLADSEFSCRRFILQSRMEDYADDFKPTKDCPYAFISLPSCACSKEEITAFMTQDFGFRVDGLLFYYSAAHYIPEQTPLVGWLKPWMLPEILDVPVPDSYMKGHEAESSKEFIEDFNEKHHHISSTEKQNQKVVEEEAKMQEG